MQKINYPVDVSKRASFESDFYTCLNKNNEITINNHLAKIPYIGGILTFEVLVKLNFEDLIKVEPELVKYSKTQAYPVVVNKKTIKKNRFNDLFTYSSNQPKIADFFMHQESFNLKICHYCGIDFINVFKDIDDYIDGLDFVNRASIHDLLIVDGIREKRANEIIKKRKFRPFTSVNQIGLTQSIRNQINRFDFKNGHNHFTLDHILPQKTHSFFSLCLYNLVPSCYSCNSKFKKTIDFRVDNDLRLVSPTSELYTFTEDFKFKLFYSKKIENINFETDFLIQKDITRNRVHIENYLAMFKINGRYTFHKDQILPIIKNKIKYPESKIKDLSKTLGLPLSEIRKIVFGKELFDDTLSNQPFIKFKRDVAKNIGIEGVI
jgi:hypothetical protein